MMALDDGEHPLPYLRPLIAIEALQWASVQPKVDPVQKDELVSRINKTKKQWVKEGDTELRA